MRGGMTKNNGTDHAAADSPAASMRTVDAVVAFLIMSLGLVVMWDSYRMGSSWGSDGPQAGCFPFYIGLILVVASLINGWHALKRPGLSQGGASFVSRGSLKMIISVVVPTTIYVGLIAGFGPIPGLGIYLASAVFIAVFMLWLGKYKWRLTVAVSLAVPIVFFLMFEVWFKVPLPKGPIEAVLGLN
jgi:putative tricarboxylic transport membrane protein